MGPLQSAAQAAAGVLRNGPLVRAALAPCPAGDRHFRAFCQRAPARRAAACARSAAAASSGCRGRTRLRPSGTAPHMLSVTSLANLWRRHSSPLRPCDRLKPAGETGSPAPSLPTRPPHAPPEPRPPKQMVAMGVPLALGTVVGTSTLPPIVSWYRKLKKPKWTPPAPLFGQVCLCAKSLKLLITQVGDGVPGSSRRLSRASRGAHRRSAPQSKNGLVVAAPVWGEQERSPPSGPLMGLMGPDAARARHRADGPPPIIVLPADLVRTVRLHGRRILPGEPAGAGLAATPCSTRTRRQHAAAAAGVPAASGLLSCPHPCPPQQPCPPCILSRRCLCHPVTHLMPPHMLC
jgi:hypothetical protein